MNLSVARHHCPPTHTHTHLTQCILSCILLMSVSMPTQKGWLSSEQSHKHWKVVIGSGWLGALATSTSGSKKSKPKLSCYLMRILSFHDAPKQPPRASCKRHWLACLPLPYSLIAKSSSFFIALGPAQFKVVGSGVDIAASVLQLLLGTNLTSHRPLQPQYFSDDDQKISITSQPNPQTRDKLIPHKGRPPFVCVLWTNS